MPIKNDAGVRLNNVAWFGRLISTANRNEQKNLNTFLAPDLTLLAYVANDYDAQTSLAEYKSQFEQVIDNALDNGSDVLLIVNGVRQKQRHVDRKWYDRACYELAKEKNVALFDINKKWGETWESANEKGFITNEVHPNDKGHRAMANAILAYLLN